MVYGISGKLCMSLHSVHLYLLLHSAVNLKKTTMIFWGETLICFFSSSGLSLRCRRLPCPAVLGSCRRTIPGSVPRMAASVQWPGESLRSQVQSQGVWPSGGARSQSAGWDTVLHWVLGHVHQWSLPGWSQSPRAHIYFFTFFLTDWRLKKKPSVNPMWLFTGKNGNQRPYCCLSCHRWNEEVRLCFEICVCAIVDCRLRSWARQRSQGGQLRHLQRRRLILQTGARTLQIPAQFRKK